MNFKNYFGMKCTNCHSTFEAIVSDTEPVCTSCGSELVPNQSSPGAYANFTCEKCNIFIAFLVGEHICPPSDLNSTIQ